MKYLLDTCTISYFVRNIPNVRNNILKIKPENIFISTITIMELEYGLQLNNNVSKHVINGINAFVDSITTLDFTDEIARISACIRAELKKTGKLIGYYDVLIAGTALHHGLTLVTSNTDEFNRVTGLKIEDWR